MPSKLLTSKLRKPHLRPDAIPRPRLLTRLDQALHPASRIIAITSPAGYGKTTAVIDWLASRELDVSWLTLDTADDDPTALFTYIVAALQTQHPHIGTGLSTALQSTQPPNLQALLVELLNELDALPTPAILVIDDAHCLRDKDTLDALAFFLANIPATLTTLLLSRAELVLPLSKWRSHGMLLDLVPDDLACTPAESADFLQTTMGLSFSNTECLKLHDYTEGWFTGLLLTGLSLRNNRTTLLPENGAPLVAQFLTEEVLLQQSPAIQTFIRHTCSLRELNPSLCNAVTGQEDARKMLAQLLSSNLFIQRISGEEETYRYHSLFADIITQWVSRTSPHLLRETHRRASRWYDAHSSPRDAVYHAIAAADYKFLAYLLEKFVPALWRSGERAILYQAFKAMPEAWLVDASLLALYAARVYLFFGDYAKVAEIVDMLGHAPDHTSAGAEPHLHAIPTPNERRGMLAYLHAGMALARGDIDALREHAQIACNKLAYSFPGWRSQAAIRLGDAYTFAGDLRRANEAYAVAKQAAQEIDDRYLILLTIFKQAKNAFGGGWLHDAEHLSITGTTLCSQYQQPRSSLAGSFLMLRALVACEYGNSTAALCLAEESITLMAQDAQLGSVAWSNLSLGRITLAARKYVQAETVLRQLEITAQQQNAPAWIAHQIRHWKARLWLAQHHQTPALLDAALRLMAPVDTLDVSTLNNRMHILDVLLWCELHLVHARHQRDRDELHLVIQRLQDVTEILTDDVTQAKHLDVHLLLALAYQEIGQMDQALECIAQSVALAQKDGFIQVFVEKGTPAARLLYQAAQAGIAEAWIGQILHAFPQDALTAQPWHNGTAPGQVDPLSERELDVLLLVSAGLTNQQIANELYISINTVRTHLRNLFSKLDVTKRTQAVARARALGILTKD